MVLSSAAEDSDTIKQLRIRTHRLKRAFIMDIRFLVVYRSSGVKFGQTKVSHTRWRVIAALNASLRFRVPEPGQFEASCYFRF